MAVRYLSERPLQVSEELRGQPLASPLRRALAFAADYMLLLLPSVAVALGVAYMSLKVTEPVALNGVMHLVRRGSESTEEYRGAVRDTVALLARHHAPGGHGHGGNARAGAQRGRRPHGALARGRGCSN